MTAAAVLRDLHRRGCRVWTADGRLHAAPADAIDPALRAAVGEHKAELLALLTGDSDLERAAELAPRVEAFRRQLSESGPIPFLRLPDAPALEGRCYSCGEMPPSDALGTRCALCARAARIALGWEVAP